MSIAGNKISLTENPMEELGKSTGVTIKQEIEFYEFIGSGLFKSSYDRVKYGLMSLTLNIEKINEIDEFNLKNKSN